MCYISHSKYISGYLNASICKTTIFIPLEFSHDMYHMDTRVTINDEEISKCEKYVDN